MNFPICAEWKSMGDGLWTTIIEYTPDMAQSVINRQTGTNYRRVIPRRLRYIVEAIRRKEFIGLSGQTIIFDENGHLIDGQHRLSAIAMGESNAKILSVCGVPAEAKNVIDRGKSRILRDDIWPIPELMDEVTDKGGEK